MGWGRDEEKPKGMGTRRGKMRSAPGLLAVPYGQRGGLPPAGTGDNIVYRELDAVGDLVVELGVHLLIVGLAWGVDHATGRAGLMTDVLADVETGLVHLPWLLLGPLACVRVGSREEVTQVPTREGGGGRRRRRRKRKRRR